jgi:hypothetical protein
MVLPTLAKTVRYCCLNCQSAVAAYQTQQQLGTGLVGNVGAGRKVESKVVIAENHVSTGCNSRK